MKKKIETFEDLPIWNDAVRIAVRIYEISSNGFLAKDFGSKEQIRRAAVSISNNIAEGFEYKNNKTFARFLVYSKGSAGGLRSNLLILKEAKLIDEQVYESHKNDLIHLSKSLEGFIKYLRNVKWQES